MCLIRGTEAYLYPKINSDAMDYSRVQNFLISKSQILLSSAFIQEKNMHEMRKKAENSGP